MLLLDLLVSRTGIIRQYHLSECLTKLGSTVGAGSRTEAVDSCGTPDRFFGHEMGRFVAEYVQVGEVTKLTVIVNIRT